MSEFVCCRAWEGEQAMLAWPDSIYHPQQYCALSMFISPLKYAEGMGAVVTPSNREMRKMVAEEEPRATSSFPAQCVTHTGSSLSPNTSQLLSFLPLCPRLRFSLGCVEKSHWDPLGTLSAEKLEKPNFLCRAACEESHTSTWDRNQLSYLSKWNTKPESRRAYFAWQLTLVITAGLVNYKYLPIRRGKLIFKHKLCYFCWACYYCIISNPANSNISKVKYVHSACNFTKQHLLLHINSSTRAIPACQVWVCTHCTQPLNRKRPNLSRKCVTSLYPFSSLLLMGMKDSCITGKACGVRVGGLWGLLMELCLLLCVPWQSVCHEVCVRWNVCRATYICLKTGI